MEIVVDIEYLLYYIILLSPPLGHWNHGIEFENSMPSFKSTRYLSSKISI